MNRTQQRIQKFKKKAKDVAVYGSVVVGVVIAGKIAVDMNDTKKRVKRLEKGLSGDREANDADFTYIFDQLQQANDAFHRSRAAFVAVRDTLEENGMKVKL